jgi:hypothetical protein
VWGVWGAWRCGRCGGVGSLLTFDIPQTALVATLDTYDFLITICSLLERLLLLVVYLRIHKYINANIWPNR